jgi:hypothetical protein
LKIVAAPQLFQFHLHAPSGLREAVRTSDRRTHLLSKGKIVFQSSFMLMTIQALEWEARAFLNRIFTLLKWLTVSGRFV